jgi:hypothetical protein
MIASDETKEDLSTTYEQHRLTMMYLGSAADVRPVFEYPQYDWVFLTPEPSHPVAIEHWPAPCLGHHLFVAGGQELFTDIIHACLGRDEWAQAQSEENLLEFVRATDGRKLRVHINCSVEEPTLAARTDAAKSSGYINVGWSPTKIALGYILQLMGSVPKEHGIDLRMNRFRPVNENDFATKIGDLWEEGDIDD